VSIVTTLKEGLVVGARSMPGNPYDGHTLDESLEQAEILSKVKPEQVFVDRGYRGVKIASVQIWKSGQKRLLWTATGNINWRTIRVESKDAYRRNMMTVYESNAIP
jgi:IS5 family transposase